MMDWMVDQLSSEAGEGGVNFTDWDSTWDAPSTHWARRGGFLGIGDWSAMRDELDPFLDGKAARRMSTYLEWLLDGPRSGGRREDVLADVAERYCRAWRSDKVISVNGHDAGRAAGVYAT